jgi:hypothetical protein
MWESEASNSDNHTGQLTYPLLAELMDEIALKVNDISPCARTRFLTFALPQTYEALAYHVTQTNLNRRVKTVGVWSLQMTASAILSAMRSMVDPMRAIYMNGPPYYDAFLPAV